LHRKEGPYRHLDIKATLQLTNRFRAALLEHLGPEVSEVLSGHRGQGRAALPHLAFLPLPFVGHAHAHGGISGVAIAVPRKIEQTDRQLLLKALAQIRREGLRLGRLGFWSVSSPDVDSPQTLRDRLWTALPKGSMQWATVTPYVYDHHSKVKDKAEYQKELAEAVRLSWERMCYESDVSVEVLISPVSAHTGVPPSHEFPRLTRKDGSECRHAHAILIFSRPVVGPIVLGAGRYRGYGLFRSLGA
jgi:CRISPR-associated protein Csb2